MRELRDDQAGALEALRQYVGKGHKRICMQAPTGYGKTVLAAALIESARAKGKRVLFTVPAISLVDQTVQSFYAHGIEDMGVMQAYHEMTDASKPVQIASVQTLMRRQMPEVDIVLLDECHRWFTAYATWLAEDGWQVPVIGLSATPWTKGLGDVYRGPWRAPKAEREQAHIIASTTGELIEKGLLSPFKVFAAPHPDLSQVRTVAGDYHEGELSRTMQEGTLVADTVETWLRLAEDRPTLCFAVDRAHAKHLQQRFEAEGVPCGYQDAYTNDIERASIRRKFHDGTYRVVCNVGTLTTGIDWDVRCISMCRPTKSDMLFVQIIGRGLRTAPGKDHCLILDHSDNHARLGFVTDIDVSYTKLKEGKAPSAERTDSIALPKECNQCGFLRSPKSSTCPQCGFKAEVVNSVKHEAGELRELKPQPKVRAVAPDFDNEMTRGTFYAELLAHALVKGYSTGWAAHKYKEKFGNWPAAQFKRLPPAGTISAYTRGYIKSRQIAYAHRPQP
jgi:DNA repair protein RadD